MIIDEILIKTKKINEQHIYKKTIILLIIKWIDINSKLKKKQQEG